MKSSDNFFEMPLEIEKVKEDLFKDNIDEIISDVYEATRAIRLEEESIFRQIISGQKKRFNKNIVLAFIGFLTLIMVCFIFHCKLIKF